MVYVKKRPPRKIVCTKAHSLDLSKFFIVCPCLFMIFHSLPMPKRSGFVAGRPSVLHFLVFLRGGGRVSSHLPNPPSGVTHVRSTNKEMVSCWCSQLLHTHDVRTSTFTIYEPPNFWFVAQYLFHLRASLTLGVSCPWVLFCALHLSFWQKRP